MEKRQYLLRLGLMIQLAFLCGARAEGEGEKPDPNGLYYQGWVWLKKAERVEKEKSFIEAFDFYRKGHALFHLITENYPDFQNREALAWRLLAAKKSLEKIHPKALRDDEELEAAGKERAIEVPKKLNLTSPGIFTLKDFLNKETPEEEFEDSIEKLRQKANELRRKLEEQRRAK